MSSLIGLSPNDNSRQQRSGSCSPPTPAVVVGSRMAPLSSHPSPNVSVGPPAPPPPTAGATAAQAAAVAAAAAAAAAGAGAASGGGAPPVAPSGLYPFLLHPGLYQHLITGKQAIKANFYVFSSSLQKTCFLPLYVVFAKHSCFLETHWSMPT